MPGISAAPYLPASNEWSHLVDAGTQCQLRLLKGSTALRRWLLCQRVSQTERYSLMVSIEKIDARL